MWIYTNGASQEVEEHFRAHRRNTCHPIHVIRDCLASQSAHEKHNQEKKPTNLCAPHWIPHNICLPCLIIMQYCSSDYGINKPFAYTRYVICVSCMLCSRDLDVLRAQRIMGFLSYPQINEVLLIKTYIKHLLQSNRLSWTLVVLIMTTFVRIISFVFCLCYYRVFKL